MTKLPILTIFATLALATAASARTHQPEARAHATTQTRSDWFDRDLQTGRSVAVEQQSPSANHATYDFGLKRD